MKIAFDFDGTISAHSFAPDALALALHASGHQIVVLTAAAGELKPADRPAEVARRLQHYGFLCLHELACVESHKKGHWCKVNQVDWLIDDSPDVLARVRQCSPTTICLQVLA